MLLNTKRDALPISIVPNPKNSNGQPKIKVENNKRKICCST
jgi:hypothetical protein